MQATAKLSHARISAQKCRLVADQVRGLPVERALEVLTFSQKKAAQIVRKVLESAIANAEHNEGADVDELKDFRDLCQRGANPQALEGTGQGPCQPDSEAHKSYT